MSKLVYSCVAILVLGFTEFSLCEEQPQKYWVFFKDKQIGSLSKKAAMMNTAKENISVRALKRRAKVRANANLLDDHDLPVSANYLQTLMDLGYQPLVISKWLNAASFQLRPGEVQTLAKLPFVKSVKKVAGARKEPQPAVPQSEPAQLQKTGAHALDYGSSFTQNELISVPAVHDLGISGEGSWIGMLDSGFKHREHEVFQGTKIIAERDFVNNDDNTENEDGQDVASQHNHGTQTLSTVGGFKEGQLVGTAFGASFLLAKTEIIPVEIPQEEDNWVAGIEWLENQGVDVVSSSLGYIDFYTTDQMDGNTAVTTRAADLAVSRGMVVVNSAGNERNNPTWGIIVAPADGDSVIAAGGVTSAGTLYSASSAGPTADGRIKPDVAAMAVSVYNAPPSSAITPSPYSFSNGTSFSCPQIAGVAALMLSAHPYLTPMEVRDALRSTADRAGNPDNDFGWGLVDAYEAVLYHGPAFSNFPVATVDSIQNVIISIKVAAKAGLAPGGVTLTYATSTNNFNNTIAMSLGQNANQYLATVPGSSMNNTLQFYFTAVDSTGLQARHPYNAPDSAFFFSREVLGVDPHTGLPQSYHLGQNYPNPFNPTTTLLYELPVNSEVTLAIYNIRGQQIRSLIPGQPVAPGRHRAEWDGRDDLGNPVASGIYFYALQANHFREMKKMVLVR